MMVREAFYAQHRWYPAGREACLRDIESMRTAAPPEGLPERPVAGIVPHAGWSMSGPTALAVFKAIASRRTPKTFVLLGAWHRARRPEGILFPSGGWETPLGLVEVDNWLGREIHSRAGGLVIEDPAPHSIENSLELQVPFIKHLAPEAKIVPILVPHAGPAVEIGRTVGRTIRDLAADAVCVGSTDLTHYGPDYGFEPRGPVGQAIRWVREENDKRIIDLMVRLDAEGVIPEADKRASACGPGAIAATLAAARELGATQGHVINYTTSWDVMRETMGMASDAAVGYVGIVF
jgi:hypothetical protein